MDTESSDDAPKQMSYGKNDSIDIQVGMSVYGPDGTLLGTVAEVAGFGATHFYDVTRGEGTEELTQARSGTGFFKIDQRAVPGQREAAGLTVPFHSVQTVTPEGTVVLNEAALGELSSRDQTNSARASDDTQTTGSGWLKRLTSSHKSKDGA